MESPFSSLLVSEKGNPHFHCFSSLSMSKMILSFNKSYGLLHGNPLSLLACMVVSPFTSLLFINKSPSYESPHPYIYFEYPWFLYVFTYIRYVRFFFISESQTKNMKIFLPLDCGQQDVKYFFFVESSVRIHNVELETWRKIMNVKSKKYNYFSR